MPRAEALRRAIHLLDDAQAILDGAGADLAAAQLDIAILSAEALLRALERDQLPLK